MARARTSSSIQPGHPPEQELLRRRVIIELHPDEMPLLDTAQKRHGTKRGAIVAALRAEARIADLETALAKNEADRQRNEAETAKELANARDAGDRLAKERDEAIAATRKTAKIATAKTSTAKRAKDAATSEIADLRRTINQLTHRLADTEAEIIEWAYCARCRAWAGRTDWTWQEGQDGQYAYHTACGDHGPGLIDPSSRLVWRTTD